jgi:hypothetical protein
MEHLAVKLAGVALFVELGIGAARHPGKKPILSPPKVSVDQKASVTEPALNGYAEATKLLVPLARAHSDFWEWGSFGMDLEVPLPLTELEQRLQPVQPLLKQLRATLRKDWRPIRNADGTLAPVWSLSMEWSACALAFTSESRIKRDRGDYPGAMLGALDTLELAEKIGSCCDTEGRVNSEVLHMIGLRQAEQTTWLLPRGAALQALIETRRLRRQWSPLSETLEREHQETALELARMFRELSRLAPGKKLKWLDDTFELSEGVDALKEGRQMLRCSRHQVLQAADRFFERQIAELRKPLRQRIPVPIPNDPWNARMLAKASWVATESWRWERMPTDLGLLEAALAVRLYFLEQGRYPEKLADLSSEWLPSVPTDLWQQPIRYRLEEDRPILYSLGPNGVDDGAQPVDPELLNLTRDTPGDLVFGLLGRRTKPAEQPEGPRSKTL